MNVIFHADDYGLSKGITDNILLCHDQGALNRISLMANGYAYDYSCQQLQQRESLGVCVHLNLIEGYPLTQAKPLVNKSSGLFNLTFLSILNADEKLKAHIFAECSAQIQRIKQTLSMNCISIDSHQHCHMVPWLFQALVKHHKSLGINRIRCAVDQMRLSDLCSAQPLSVAKNALLGVMHFLNNRKPFVHQFLQENREFFWGLLYTGKQNSESLKRSHQRIQNRMKKSVLEILLHPGQATLDEENLWKHYPKLLTYYYSPDRLQEQQTLITLKKYSQPFLHGS